MTSTALYTVGHSNRSLEDFVALLQSAGIKTLVDVRAYPQSRRHPQLSRDTLSTQLAQAGISYRWAGKALGGRRRSRKGSPHTALEADGFRGYADHMASDEFQRGVGELIELARHDPTVIMCAERLPEHCHRSFISDYLNLQGAQVMHLIAPGEMRPHQLNPLARVQAGGLVYDRNTQGALDLG